MPMLFSVVVAKICMLTLGCFFGRVAREGSRPSPGSQELYSGMFALLMTNGDEVGLGVPAMTALVRLAQRREHSRTCDRVFPDMMPVLFVLAGIQKMCFLPPALVLLGMSDALRDTASDGTNENSVSVSNILAQVLRAKLRDPLVLGILCGTLYNIVGPAKLLDHSHDATPWTIGGYTPGLFGGSWVHPYITM
eukprot:7385037-Prymnesium_polylepis.2